MLDQAGRCTARQADIPPDNHMYKYNRQTDVQPGMPVYSYRCADQQTGLKQGMQAIGQKTDS